MKITLTSRLVAAGIGLAALVGFAPSAKAAEYHVRNSGSDSNPGSEGKPWQTLKKASESARPGDVVLFGEGETFVGTLRPAYSGTANSPVVFMSRGKPAKIVSEQKSAAVYFNKKQNIRILNLDLSSPEYDAVSFDGEGEGTRDITLEKLNISHCGRDGINSTNPKDEQVKVLKCNITNVKGRGVMFVGSKLTVDGTTITTTQNNQLPLYGISARGAEPTITNNNIDGFQKSGILISKETSLVSNNKISCAQGQGEEGISYYQETSRSGRTIISNNEIRGVKNRGISVDNGLTTRDYSTDKLVASTSESFEITGNKITMNGDSSSEAIRVYKVPSVKISYNEVDGIFSKALNLYSPTGTYFASGNTWAAKRNSDQIFMINGRLVDIRELQHESKRQHREDKLTRPNTGPNRPQTPTLPATQTTAPTANPYRPLLPRIVPSATARPTNQVQYSTPQVGGLVDPRLRPSWSSYSPGMQAQIWSQYTNAVQQHIQKTANQMPAQNNLPSQKK